MSSTDSSNDNIKNKMNTNYTYPSPTNKNFQSEIYKKREFYFHKIPKRPELTNYNEIKEYRDNVCTGKFALQNHQSFLSNYINPDTPYKGILIFHGTGTGKCVLPETQIYTNGNLIEAHNLWKQYSSDNIIIDEDGGEWCKPIENITVNSLNNKNKIIEKNVVNLYREKVNTTIRNIELENGLSIRLTLPHKLRTNNGWTNKLNIGDSITIPSNQSKYGNNINYTLDNDVLYIPIKNITYEEYSGYVYDFEVDTHHNYIANGILCHNTCAAIAITEKFKDVVQKYNTKIYILVSGPLIKENWKNELLKCTGEAYLKYEDKTAIINEQEQSKNRKNALNIALQYYRFMSYRSFYKKVLGEKIVERKTTKDNKTRVSYRKTDDGEFERDIAVDRIYNLNNAVIVIDEAHNLTGNAYGEALLKVIKASKNLRVILLTATPMKNLADDIVELINFIRPSNSPMLRDKIFTSQKNHEMDIKSTGLEYIRNMTRGYVSYLRGADPMTFAKKIEKGVIPKGLLFSKLTLCKMNPFQRKIYDEAIEEKDDSLDRRAEAVANFAFPGLSEDKKSIKGYYGREGINIIKGQLKVYYELLNKKVAQQLTEYTGSEVDETDFVHISENGKTISGSILKFKYLKYYSIKFYKALKKLNRLFWGKKGARTGFVYSNLVKVGIELFQEILMQNGYLEYQENSSNYVISGDTICYFCGKTYREHQKQEMKKAIEMGRMKTKSDSSTDYEKPKGKVPEHEFHPATFVSVTGKSTDELSEDIPEDKQQILAKVFNHIDNIQGKYIKLVLGSKVMNEGISLANVAELHILDVHFNLGKVDQVMGRGIRHCQHYNMMSKDNPFPEVNVYKYAVTLEKGLSNEEELYKKAELKYLLIKKVERAIKDTAIDCPLNRHGNIFPEEVKQYKDCYNPKEPVKGKDMCPAVCDYMKCEFKCEDALLNNKYYDPKRKLYTVITKNKLDMSTFTNSLAKNEIDNTKKIIKDMYKTKYAYTLDVIVSTVKSTYKNEKYDLFDEFFVYKALDELIPVTENDFNNFKDTILDKYNRSGYLIYINKYYIFQPYDQNEDVPMYYRTTYNKPLVNKLSLYNYLKNTTDYKQRMNKKKSKNNASNMNTYDFDGTMEYYDTRNEFKYVGIIDKELSRRKNKHDDEIKDVFKIREKRSKILEKKRGTGIPSLKGAVCATSKSKDYLESIAKKLKVKTNGDDTRIEICNRIKNKMLELEKYGTSKDKNKYTYVMIPKDHPKYKFPYNLEDRVNYIIDDINEHIKFGVKVNVKNNKSSNGYTTYELIIEDNNKLKDFHDYFKSLGATLTKGKWIIKIE